MNRSFGLSQFDIFTSSEEHMVLTEHDWELLSVLLLRSIEHHVINVVNRLSVFVEEVHW